MVEASANEFGGMMQTSPSKSTKPFESKALGSTIEVLMLVNSLKCGEQRTS